jgi:hypothetical protein
MKKALAVLLLALLPFSFAIADSASSLFTTQVKATVDYTLTLTPSFGAVSAITPGATSTSIGTIAITSNLNGWTLVIKSANGSKMIREGGTQEYPYRLTLGSEVANYDLATDLTVTKNGAQPATTLEVILTYATAASLNLPAGVYVDTLTFTLTAL